MPTDKYKCIQCKKIYNPMRYAVCPYCNAEQPLEKVAEFLEHEIVDVACEKCGSTKSLTFGFYDGDDAYCAKCRCWTSGDKIGQYIYSDIDAGNVGTKIECPYCHSTNTRKISELSKAGSIALWGIFAIGKSTKQWHCNNCKSDF